MVRTIGIMCAPYAGITRVRFDGYVLRLGRADRTTPVERLHDSPRSTVCKPRGAERVVPWSRASTPDGRPVAPAGSTASEASTPPTGSNRGNIKWEGPPNGPWFDTRGASGSSRTWRNVERAAPEGSEHDRCVAGRVGRPRSTPVVIQQPRWRHHRRLGGGVRHDEAELAKPPPLPGRRARDRRRPAGRRRRAAPRSGRRPRRRPVSPSESRRAR